MPSKVLAPQRNKVRPLSNTLRRCGQNFTHHVRAFWFGEILVGGTGLRRRIGGRMASRSPDLTRSNSPPNVLSTLQSVWVSCVAPAACFTLRSSCLTPFCVNCVILWWQPFGILWRLYWEWWSTRTPFEYCWLLYLVIRGQTVACIRKVAIEK